MGSSGLAAEKLTDTITMRHLISSLMVTLLPLVRSAPGMTSWVCRSCANPNILFSAEARVLAPDGGEVGRLRLLQSLPRDESAGTAGPVMIDTVDNRVRLARLKTYSYQVEVRAGTCDRLGDLLAAQYCSGCSNSLGVAIINTKDGQQLQLSDISDTHSVVFFDKKNSQSKLGCGEIREGKFIENA